MYRDFQFYDSRIVDYTRIGETLTLFCVYGTTKNGAHAFTG